VFPDPLHIVVLPALLAPLLGLLPALFPPLLPVVILASFHRVNQRLISAAISKTAVEPKNSLDSKLS
jgi:hypothetical protein